MSKPTPRHADPYKYMTGFGGHFESEALPNALPDSQNSPQVCPYGLYAEQLSGTAFTVPRDRNQRSWLYRILPAVRHHDYQKVEAGRFSDKFDRVLPNQLRWLPFPHARDEDAVDFVQGMNAIAGAGDPTVKTGIAIYQYSCNRPMVDKAFYNSDGDMLIVPEHGALRVRTEFGYMLVNQGEIFVIQRGIRFAVEPLDGLARGYVCEVYGGHFRIPDLGPIGANGLANPRDFQHPTASFEDRTVPGGFTVVAKFLGQLWSAQQDHSCFDVVAWHGNYVPYKYDLAKFCPMNAVSYDHPDPSIFTVLTCPTNEPGVAACDFVFFPPRWGVADHTFRPPYFHRNCMSEFMGLIRGKYEAKEGGFMPGGASLHSCCTPHGPDREVFEATIRAELKPQRIAENDMAFMFESTYLLKVADWAADAPNLDRRYMQAWLPLVKHFDPSWTPASSAAAAGASPAQ